MLMKTALSRKNLWENTPASLKRVFGFMMSAMPPAYLLGSDFRKQRDWLHRAQWWSAEQNREFQLEQIQRICHIAYRTDYYKALFDEVGFKPEHIRSLECLRELPFLDRQGVQMNLNRMCSASALVGNIDYVTTGGTTGFPLRFYMSPERHAIEYAHLLGGWERVGYQLGNPMVVLRGRIVKMDAALGFHHEYDPLLRHHYYSNFHMDPKSMKQYVGHMSSLGPLFVHAYPSAAYALARFISSGQGASLRNVRGVLLESEKVPTEQRQYISDTFDCPVFSSYGHTEKLIAAAECEHSSVYHVWPTYGFLELIDDNGNPVEQTGRRGEIVGTGFINSVVPFIRYRTGDFATYLGNRCSACGREHVLLGDLCGHRRQESLALSDGTLITWTALMASIHDDTFDCVQRFQFVQERPGAATMRFIASRNFTVDDQMRILGNLNRKFQNRLRLELERVDELPLTKSGKMIYVKQKIKDLATTGEA